MSHSPPAEDSKPRACSVVSASTVAADESGRKNRKGSRAKHSWEYVPVDPAEDEAPPANASRLEKELFSSFTNNFLTGQGRRTRAAAIHASQNFHEHSGSELSQSSHSHPASESAFSTATTTTNTAASPASSPAPPSAPTGSRKRKDSAAPTSDSHRKRPKTSTPAPSATSDPLSTAAPVTAAASVPAPSPPPHQAPAVQRAQSAHPDRSAASAWTSRAADGQAKDSGKRKSTVFDDATNKTKTNKKTDSKPSPAPDPFEINRKRKSSPAADKMAPKVKKAKTANAAADATKSAKAAAIQKRDSLLQEDVYAQNLSWSSDAHQKSHAPTPNGQRHQTHSKSHHKQQHHPVQRVSNYSPTRAQLAEQLEEITHRGIAGGPANYSSLREYRAACAAEAAWQERDQEVVERMLDNPRVIEVLKRLRELNAEIAAERTGAKGMGKGHAKGGRKRKVTDDLMDGD